MRTFKLLPPWDGSTYYSKAGKELSLFLSGRTLCIRGTLDDLDDLLPEAFGARQILGAGLLVLEASSQGDHSLDGHT